MAAPAFVSLRLPDTLLDVWIAIATGWSVTEASHPRVIMPCARPSRSGSTAKKSRRDGPIRTCSVSTSMRHTPAFESGQDEVDIHRLRHLLNWPSSDSMPCWSSFALSFKWPYTSVSQATSAMHSGVTAMK